MSDVATRYGPGELQLIDGDVAGCESYSTSMHIPKGDPPRALHSATRYLDRLERREGEWRIMRRQVVPGSTAYFPIELVSLHGVGSRDLHEPSGATLRGER